MTLSGCCTEDRPAAHGQSQEDPFIRLQMSAEMGGSDKGAKIGGILDAF